MHLQSLDLSTLQFQLIEKNVKENVIINEPKEFVQFR